MPVLLSIIELVYFNAPKIIFVITHLDDIHTFSTISVTLTLISSLDKLCSTCPLQKHFSCFLDSVILSVPQVNIQSSSRYSTRCL